MKFYKKTVFIFICSIFFFINGLYAISPDSNVPSLVDSFKQKEYELKQNFLANKYLYLYQNNQYSLISQIQGKMGEIVLSFLGQETFIPFQKEDGEFSMRQIDCMDIKTI